MAISKKVVVMPSSEEILKRLRSVYNDDYMAERFYPLIAQSAGRQLVGEGVVMMLTLAIADFVRQGYPPQMEAILMMYAPMYIDALVDDKEVAKTAKRFLKEATGIEEPKAKEA